MDGLKARLSFDAVVCDYDDEYLTIDTDTHIININNLSRLFGVQYDGNSRLIKFRIKNQLSDIQKMQDSIVYINWIDSKGVKGRSIAIDKTISNDICEFAWKVPFDALKNSGVLHFAMSAFVIKDGSSVIDQRWSTQIASVTTPDGIYIKSYTPGSEEEDRITQIYNKLVKMINEQSENLQKQVNSLNENLGNYIHKPNLTDNNKFPRAKDGNVEWVEQGLPTDTQTSSAINKWMDAHIEEIATIQNGSITEQKINSNFLPKIKNVYVTPEMFGAYGDGKHDDTVAIQTAVNSGFNITFNVATYLISSAINVGSNKKISGITCGTPVIKCNNCNGFNIDGKNTILSNLEIQNADIGVSIGDGVTLQDSNVTIEKVTVKYSKIGFKNNSKSRATNIYDCIANGCDYGFWIGYTDCKISKCGASVIKYHGFYVPSANNVLENCKAFFCGSVKTNDLGQISSGFYITGEYTKGINLMTQQNYYCGVYIDASYCSIDAHSDADGKANEQTGDSYGMVLDGTKNIIEFTCVGGRNIDGDLFSPDIGIKLRNKFDKCIVNLMLTSLSTSKPMTLYDIQDWHYNNGFIVINGVSGNVLNLNNPAPLKNNWSVGKVLVNVPEIQINNKTAIFYESSSGRLSFVEPTSRELQRIQCGVGVNDNDVVTIKYLKDKGLIS